MQEGQLKIGLITHWECNGFHGLHQVVDFNSKYVHCTDPESKFDRKRIGKIPLKTFCFQNSTGSSWDVICDYPETHKFLHCVGKVFPIGEPLPTYKEYTKPSGDIKHDYVIGDGHEEKKKKHESLEDRWLTKRVTCDWGCGKIIGIDYGRLAIKLNKPYHGSEVCCFYESEVKEIKHD